MAKLVKHDHYDEYVFFDMENDTYKPGDDCKCPVCGAELDGYSDLHYSEGVAQGIGYCHNCNHALTFNFYLQNVIAE